jgi:hypothetical protein
MHDDFPQWKQELPEFPHKLVNDLATLLTDFYKEHIRRDVNDGKLPPYAWTLLGGLLTSAMQTYASICILLAEKRPKPLMMQAGVLARALFENLATVLALTEKPDERALIFLSRSHQDVRREVQARGRTVRRRSEVEGLPRRL